MAMKTIAKLALVLLMGGLALAAGAPDHSEFLESFRFQGRSYSLFADFSPPKAGLRLAGRRSRDLSAGLAGESILLGVRSGTENFYVFWIYSREKTLLLAWYDHRLDRRRVLPLPGFSFFALPEIIETQGVLRELYFLGNDSGNDDIFHYDLQAGELTALTRTPFSEKGFTLKAAGAGIEIETRSLWKAFRYRFDPRERRCELLEEHALPKPRRRAAAAIDPSRYYNTYVGFGDSITRGQWEGVEWPDLCFIAKIGQMLAESYGPTWSVNLGIGGTDTLKGAERVEQDLDNNPGFYFLLMYGVNDVFKGSFSLESSLENLEFMIDAAQARGMRVIASTLTPRKDKFATAYYWHNLHALSAGIIDLADRKGAAHIDPLTAFMNTNPPDGWQDLLESIDRPRSSGNHPIEEGHRIIASLFAPVLAAWPPYAPQNVAMLPATSDLQRTVSWDTNLESDISHYRINFDFSPQTLNYFLTTAANHHTFPLFPFFPELYFRVQAVDRSGNGSEFSTVNPVQAATARPAKKIE
jgi:lysophospholipase L1-like esterase